MSNSPLKAQCLDDTCLCQSDIADEVSQLLTSLANTQRLMVVHLLLEMGEMHVSKMAEKLRVNRASLSRHLTRLREVNVVRTRRDQNRVYYSLNHDKAAKIVQSLLI